VTHRRPVARLAALVLSGLVVVSCADTVVDESVDSAADAADDASSTATTSPIIGSTAELLAEMSTQMSQLSAQISAEGDERATLERIESIWAIARVDVESTTPELVGGIDTTVDMARTAVVRIRPADGDKAFQILTDLVDRYTGDS
jgi:hypothetical protein